MNYPTPEKLHLQQCPEYFFIPEYKHGLDLEIKIRQPIIFHHIGMRGVGKTREMLHTIGNHPHFKIDAENGRIIVLMPEDGVITYNFGPFKKENIFKKIKRKFRNLIRWIKIKRMVLDLTKKLV